jgi:hypothetical protein
MGQTYISNSNAFSTVTDPVRMADRIMLLSPASDAEALKLLRFRFPDSSLSLRVAALDFLLRRTLRHRGALQA